MSRARIEAEFPRLKRARYALTSPETPSYNCIAWAAQDTERWWWPTPPYGYWPPDVPRAVELQAFVAAFASLRYQECGDGEAERGFDKVAIFADKDGKPTHVARQLSGGRWSSKLGPWEDISHSIYGLEGALYGNVVKYLKRAAVKP